MASDGKSEPLKRRSILSGRKLGGSFCVEETETRKQASLGTKNRAEDMRAITHEEHQLIVEREKDPERRKAV